MNAFGLHRRKEETLTLILEENARKNPAKPWISNRQIYLGSGTVLTGCKPLTGVMVESHLTKGAQALKDPKDLKYGMRITDACLGWELTERMLRHGAVTIITV
ncbi:MAG: hypothetical protein NTX70_06465 [Verrucomicrobia bacterium]|nr:hypothetical protein [Verrucomicrobiota bacterium]